MSTQISPVAGTGSAQLLRKIVAWLDRNRIRITVVVFVSLVAEDVLSGFRPHGVIAVSDWHSVVGTSCVLLGVLLRSWAAGTLHKMDILTTSGPYRFVRHPLYVGSFLMMVGFCLVIGDYLNLCIVVGPLAALYAVKIRREEKLLARQFGDAWSTYARRTRRFIPRLIPHKSPLASSSVWELRQWLFNREYEAFAGAMAGLVAIQLWHLAAA